LAEQMQSPVSPTNDHDAGAETDDAAEQIKIGARLREAREYVGLLQEDVASALGIPRASVSALEAGKRRVTGLEARRLARIYRKPVGWLLGEQDIELSDTEPLYRATNSLSVRDREQVLQFAEFLAAAGRPAGSRRTTRESRSPAEEEDSSDEEET
jgi:transcriptional regulator with XRE-family HTH domain